LSFPLTCSNASLGCVWEGTLSKYEDHLEECTFVTCQCGKTMKRTEFDQHKTTACPKSKRPCPLSHLGCSLKNEVGIGHCIKCTCMCVTTLHVKAFGLLRIITACFYYTDDKR
jgi:hypothetical protein